MTENKTVLAWLEEMKAMCQPDNVVWIDGSEEQLEALRAEAVETGEMIKLNQEKLPLWFCRYYSSFAISSSRLKNSLNAASSLASSFNRFIWADVRYQFVFA